MELLLVPEVQDTAESHEEDGGCRDGGDDRVLEAGGEVDGAVIVGRVAAGLGALRRGRGERKGGRESREREGKGREVRV